jgi:hypothetical protein
MSKFIFNFTTVKRKEANFTPNFTERCDDQRQRRGRTTQTVLEAPVNMQAD